MVDQKTKAFIQKRLDQDQVPSNIVEALVRGGWNQAQATAAVQEVSGVQLAAPTGPGGYIKPPFILRVLYVFAFLGLLLGLFLVVAVGALLAEFDDGSSNDIFAVILGWILLIPGLLLIANFFLIRAAKRGSLKALKILTVLVVLAFASGLVPVATDEINAAVAPSAPFNFLQLLIVLYIWKRHRAYFR